MVLASLFAHLRAIADHLGETARIRGLLRPVAPSNCAPIPDGRIWTRFRPYFFFEIFPRNLRSVSRNSHGWILRALWFTFPRVMSSNVVSVLSYFRFCDDFFGSCISYPRRPLAFYPREWLCSFLRRRSYVENSALSYLFLKKHATQILSKST